MRFFVGLNITGPGRVAGGKIVVIVLNVLDIFPCVSICSADFSYAVYIG